MVAKIDVDALKIYEQIKKLMRLKIGKKLKTASHNLKFIDSYQKKNECIVCIFYCRLLTAVIH